VYTHLGQGINVLRDPPKSPRWRAAALEKRGTLNPAPPFFKGGWGGSNPVEAGSEDLCVHGSPLWEKGVGDEGYKDLSVSQPGRFLGLPSLPPSGENADEFARICAG